MSKERLCVECGLGAAALVKRQDLTVWVCTKHRKVMVNRGWSILGRGKRKRMEVEE